MRHHIRQRNRSGKRTLGFAAVCAAALFCVFFVWDLLKDTSTETIEAECEFHFVDVGQGDCAMFITENSAVVIDTGTAGAASDTEKYIKSYTNKIDYLFLTHPHEDHIGGAGEIIENIKVDNIVMTDAASDTYTFTSLLDAIEKSGANVVQASAGDTYSTDDLDMAVLAPLGEFDTYNNYSMVVKVSYGEISALVTGDAEKASEKAMLDFWDSETLHADVLKLAHHGSSTSTGKNFLVSVDPRWAVISCGENNMYGHPHDVTVELLDDFSIPYARTDEMGSVVFRTDGRDIYLADGNETQ